MDNVNDIKIQLDNYYQEYKDNKNILNGAKTKAVAKLIVDISSFKDGSVHDVATELVRFSAEVSMYFFDSLTKSKTIPLDVIETVLKELMKMDTDAKFSQYYVSKYAFAIVPIIRCYKTEAFQSTILPQLVEFIARFAVKSEKGKSKFYNLINNSSGEIFRLDFSNISKNSLSNIWNAINKVYPDYSKSQYESLITEWGKKYGFIKETVNFAPSTGEKNEKVEDLTPSNAAPKDNPKDTEVQETNSENIVAPIVNEDTNTISSVIADKSGNKTSDVSNEDSKTTSEKTIAETSDKDNSTSAVASEKTRPAKSSVQILYERLKKDMDKEQEAIITAFTDMITPVGKAFESIQGEINKSREIGSENISLKSKITDLEAQLSEYRTRLQTANQSLITAKAENDELKAHISTLESQNSELDSKLNDAYAINSRESSLEAEKIRSELKKAFAFLYEDWLEYEFSDVSEENYESLQAIIKKIFRSLERNGIDFKGNN